MQRFLAPLFVVCLAAVSGCGNESDPPNIILVMTDDQGYGDIRAHGNPLIKTPNLDWLHGESIRLTDFHVDPTCSPTRAALMTGRYSTRTGVWHTIMGRSLMNPEELTVAEVLAMNGYQTGMVGKWHLGDNYPLRPQDQGFDEAFYHLGGGVGQGPDYFGNDYYDDTYVRNGVEEMVDGYVTDVWFDDALDFIDKHKERPFFLYLSTNAPHGPYYVDEKYWRPYADSGATEIMAKFLGMITNIDDNMGRLTRRLDELGLADNTILIFMTDNGSAEGWSNWRNREGTWPGFNAGMRAGKGSEYDGGHRVPFYVRWPAGKLTGGRDVDQLTAHIDVLPTLMELADVEDPGRAQRDGSSLASALRSSDEALRDRTLFVHSQRVPDPIKWRKSAVMTERWRLVNQHELYDIVDDPGQNSDVAGDHPGVVADLQRQYDAWWTSLSSSFPDVVRIALGSDASNPVNLSAHDWFVPEQSQSPWSQNHIRNGTLGNGHWAVDVRSPGRYRITLRRWPASQPGPIEAVHARVKVSSIEVESDVVPDDNSVEFIADLDAGPTTLQTWLTLPSGESRGAYYVSVERMASD